MASFANQGQQDMSHLIVPYSNPPTIIQTSPHSLTHLPPSKHPPTLGPPVGPLKLEPSPYNPKKKEPIPLALHYCNTMGSMTPSQFMNAQKTLLLQFWTNEKDAVRRLPGFGGRLSQKKKKSTQKKGALAAGLYTPPGITGLNLYLKQTPLTEQDFKNHNDLPLARIKRIMKSDEDVRMISAEAPIVFAKACELFILELSIRSYSESEKARRRQVTREDVLEGIQGCEYFDFLAACI
ncbi:hypothetical protein TL16_g01901 [Triparma laevis f. inornata]|uniref:Transcription factor CBF/NF-Y/archaeal histone domain-containing protein n=2 Tax=Triparma laevis TaxID=1534972 RepID=A0A9W7APN1_9STRA|nr:hypothetical protein TL16_g01901 [Triparma laevis f. inornata]GMH72099.1 hypothetical protein TrLO_g6973 [Triparma laevis f. longispina]